MSHSKPFHRNFREFAENSDPKHRFSKWAYITDRDYAKAPEHYVRAFIIVQSDLQRLFEYIEPSDQNLSTYSYRIHELLMRTCIEIEANFKAILRENTFKPVYKSGKKAGTERSEENWNIHDYKKVNKTHHLSSYKVHCPVWDGTKSILEPFINWKSNGELLWYQAYNNSKHNSQNKFKEANLENLLKAIGGLLVLLSSQFCAEDFSGRVQWESESDILPGMGALGDYFRIEFPNDWNESEKYDFNWNNLKNDPNRFQKIDFDNI